MPFQSEKQRRYLWANEPEIARDWTDTYGSGIGKALGGRIPFALGSTDEIIETQSDIGTQVATRTQEDIDTITKMRGYEIQEPNFLLDLIKDQLSPGFTVDDMIEIQKHGKDTKATALLNDPYAEIKGLLANRTTEKDFRYTDSTVDADALQKLLDSNLIQNKEPNKLEQGIAKAFVTDDTEDDLKALSYQENPYDIPKSRSIIDKLLGEYKAAPEWTQAHGASGDPIANRGYTGEQLDSMNARGGWYSEPARQARRWSARQSNVLKRAGEGKAIGNVDKLLGEYGYSETPSGGLSFDPAGLRGDPNAGTGYSRDESGWENSSFARGGITNVYKKP